MEFDGKMIMNGEGVVKDFQEVNGDTYKGKFFKNKLSKNGQVLYGKED
jgi:hypothetical protein